MTHAAVLSIDAQALGQIETRIVGDRRGMDTPGQSLRLQQGLHAGKLGHGQRALQRIVAAGIEESDDGRLSREEFLEGDRRAVVILEHGRCDRRARTRLRPAAMTTMRSTPVAGAPQHAGAAGGSLRCRPADRLDRPVEVEPQLPDNPLPCLRSTRSSVRTPAACGPSQASVASSSRTGLVPVAATAYSP